MSEKPLDTASVRRLIKRLARHAGLEDTMTGKLSGYSMRVRAAQDMMVAGIGTMGIMQAGGWRTYHVLARYVENARADSLHQRRWARIRQVSATVAR